MGSVTVEELLSRIDIVDFLSQYVDLTEENGEWWGLSPLADPPEKTPSFSVRREAGKFYCFSTGIGGSLITFLKFHDHISTAEAIHRLEQYAGLDGETTFQPRQKMAATQVCQKYQKPRQTVKACKNKPLPATYMDKFEKNPEKFAAWLQEGISQASLDRFEVRYDRFSNRLVYPIRNLKGEIVNVGGRTLDPDFKAKKLRKYSYFFGWDGGMDLIYGLFENREAIQTAGEVILFEGCKSVLLADTFGIQNTGALLTSHLSPAQMKILARLGVRVVFALDKEIDVRKDHNVQKLSRYAELWTIWDTENLLSEKDAPVDHGEAVFRQLLATKRRLTRQ